MSTERYERIPELTLGWRLKMALGDMSREAIAVEMDVSPSTISRWMADQGAPPKRPYLLRWAMVTGVAADWLESGVANGGGFDPGPGKPSSDKLARLTEQKRDRSRAPRATRRYLPKFPLTPAAA